MEKSLAYPASPPGTPIPTIRRVSLWAPLDWIRRGIADFAAAPLPSLAYGLAFALLGLGLSYAAAQRPQLSLSLFAALLAVGPFLAAGLYRIATIHRQGRERSSGPGRRLNRGGIAVFALAMLLVTVAAIRLVSIIVALYFAQLAPAHAVIAEAAAWPLLGILLAGGVVFGFALFAASALSLPMISDGRAELVPAVITSLRAVAKQPGPMLVWAGLIALLTLLGIASLFVGLVVLFPILAYATWNSYQDLVR